MRALDPDRAPRPIRRGAARFRRGTALSAVGGAPVRLADLLGSESPADRLVGLRRDDPSSPDRAWLPPRALVVEDSGRWPRGSLFMAADDAMGTALHRGVPDGFRLVTSHLHVEIASDDEWLGSEVECLPEVVSCDHRSGLAVGRLVAAGRHIGMASARFEVVAFSDRTAQLIADQPVVALETPTPDRPVDIDELAGLRTVPGGEGGVDAEVVAHPGFANERGGLHGGMGGWLIERLATRAVVSTLGGRRPIPVEARVVFVRPVAADGGTMFARTTFRRLGRRVAVTATAVRTADGKDVLLGDTVHVFDAT